MNCKYSIYACVYLTLIYILDHYVAFSDAQELQPPPTKSLRQAEYAINDVSHNNHAEASVPLLQLQHDHYRPKAKSVSRPSMSTSRYSGDVDTSNTIVTMKATAIADQSNSDGPDVVMSTAVPLKIYGKIAYFVNAIQSQNRWNQN